MKERGFSKCIVESLEHYNRIEQNILNIARDNRKRFSGTNFDSPLSTPSLGVQLID